MALKAFVQIHLAHHVALYATWLLFMCIYAMAFRAMRPIMVLPNLIMQIFVLVIVAVLVGEKLNNLFNVQFIL